MAFHLIQHDALEYLVSDTLAPARHCFTTRLGGVSQGHLASLNLGVHRGDGWENLRENYSRLGSAVGFLPENTVFTNQIHTDRVLRVSRDSCGAGLFREQTNSCDALITNRSGIALCCFSADCVPILLYDPVKKAAAAVHSGWRGTALGIVAKTVRELTAAFGCCPQDVHAAIGPCISQCCFETDRDVPDAMREALGEEAEAAIRQTGEKYHVDLKALNRLWLERSGVKPEHIDITSACTACEPDRYWSHRRVGDARGSMAGIIQIP